MSESTQRRPGDDSGDGQDRAERGGGDRSAGGFRGSAQGSAPHSGGARRREGDGRAQREGYRAGRDGSRRDGAPREGGYRGQRDGAPREGGYRGQPREGGYRGRRDAAPGQDRGGYQGRGDYQDRRGSGGEQRGGYRGRRDDSGERRSSYQGQRTGGYAWKRGDSAGRRDERREGRPEPRRDERGGGSGRGGIRPGNRYSDAPRYRDAPRDGGRAPFRGRGDGRDERRGSRPPQSVREERPPEPFLPDEVIPQDLDRQARGELKTLSKENAEAVARHLVMAGRLIDEDPALAHQHAQAAERRAGRVGVVRETLGITAYATGDFALALRELRTHRRISGSNEQLALMVDSERGMERPDKALELGRSVPRTELSIPARVQLAIAMSGARLDLGQNELALTELEIPELQPDVAYSYSPTLFRAYATVLVELGRGDEAAQWEQRAQAAEDALGLDLEEDDEITVIDAFDEDAADPAAEQDPTR